MSRLLNDLDPRFLPRACELIARCVEAGIPVMIIFTGRTQAEQDDLFAQGRTKPGPIVTWTRDSLHVMKPPLFKARAIDVAPYDQYLLHGVDKLKWDISDPVWQKMGEIGEKIGLKWGVVDSMGVRKDLGHFEDRS